MIKCLLDRVNYYRPYNMGLKICASTCVKKSKRSTSTLLVLARVIKKETLLL